MCSNQNREALLNLLSDSLSSSFASNRRGQSDLLRLDGNLVGRSVVLSRIMLGILAVGDLASDRPVGH